MCTIDSQQTGSSERQRTSRAAAQQPKLDVHGCNVLIVDDEPLVRDTTGSVLRAHGCSVHFAADGVEEVTTAARLPQIDLVLLDTHMPGTPLRDTFHALQTALPKCKVLLTSGNDPGILRSARGAQDCVHPKAVGQR